MGIKGKLEVEVEVEVDVKCKGDIFYELFSRRPHHVSTITPSKIHGCDLHHGEFGKPGSIILWNCTIDGKKCVEKHLVEEIDEKNKLVRFKTIEGHLLNEFKSFNLILHVVPKEEITTVNWTIEFETTHDKGHYPTKVMDFNVDLIRDIEAYHLKA